METLGHFINGKMVLAESGQRGDVFNPAKAEVIRQVAFASQVEVDNAISAAKAAFPSWSQQSPMRRARVLFRFKELLETNLDKLAAIVTEEHGKVFEDAQGSCLRGLELVEFACGIGQLLKGSFSENVASDIDCYTVRQALGVCVGVSPFNFPVMVPIWMFVNAIACGNTFVLKPSERNPSAPLFLAELMQEAGLPDGVLNIVNGDKVAVDALCQHPDVAAVTAVASTPVAESIYKTATQNGKRSATFGGAKNHCIVMPDVDIEQTAKALLGAAYGSAGERCMAVSVAVTVDDHSADALVAELQKQVPELKIGPGNQTGMDMGPLITREHLDRVKKLVQSGVDEGASLLVDGRMLTIPGYEHGYFMGGCLFDHVTPDMRIYQEEIFGPVLCIVRARDFDHALSLINENRYGNGTAIFTNDGEAARTFAARVQVGMVGINVPIPVPVAYHSFGGWKQSSFGDYGMHGDQSVQFYTKAKTITSRWPKGLRADANYHMPTHK